MDTILNGFDKYAKSITDVLTKDSSRYGTAEEQEYINEVYPQTDNISIDYAILEKSDNVKTIPSDIGWSDLGTWNSLYGYMDKDEEGNVLQGDRLQVIQASNNLIRSKNKDKLIVVKGLEDFIIVDDEDALLIYPKSQEQEIKAVRNNLPYEDMK